MSRGFIRLSGVDVYMKWENKVFCSNGVVIRYKNALIKVSQKNLKSF